MLPRKFLGIMLVFVAVSVFTTTGSAFAASCKGMEKPKCESTAGCYWVDSYKRKDGVQVSGHCRGKPGTKKDSGEKKDKKPSSESSSGSSTKSGSNSSSGSN